MCGSVFVALVLEGVARVGCGLGDPPLSEADPEVEYLCKPGRYRRFGNEVVINSHHMRSEEFPLHKQNPAELRILVLGDSVVHGGGLTDQGELATEMLKVMLREQRSRPVIVGNISAGSWGPGNLYAYVRRFGVFDADLAIVVIHSYDIGDNPTGIPVVGVHPGFPEKPPVLALIEVVSRYIVPRLVGPPTVQQAGSTSDNLGNSPPEGGQAEKSMLDLTLLCKTFTDSGVPVVIAQYPTQTELGDEESPGREMIRRCANDAGIRYVDLRPFFVAAFQSGESIYRPGDDIHPNEAGHRLIAKALARVVMDELGLQR